MSANTMTSTPASTETTLPSWAIACLEGIGADDGVGEDSRYSDRFAWSRSEVSRLSGADFPAVFETCCKLLNEEGKDLRVLAYLCLAAVATHGVAGLTGALALFAQTLERYGDRVYPQREVARQAALEFLATDRLPALAAQASDADETAAVQGLNEALERLSASIQTTLGIMGWRPRPLAQWTQRRLARSKAETEAEPPRPEPAPAELSPTEDTRAEAAEAKGQAQPRTPVAARADGAMDDAASLDSERAFQTGVRRALGYLRDAPDWLRLVAFGRALRWSGLSLPPADNGRTQIAPPRDSALAAVRAAVEQRAWHDGLLAAERAFLEPGAQFCFCLQRWAAQCATGLDETAVVTRLEIETRLLVKTLPALPGLRFSDDRPFADAEDRAWIDSLFRGLSAPEPTVSEASEGSVDWWGVATERFREDGLVAALEALEAIGFRSGREAAERTLVQARLCLEQGRPEIAGPVLEALVDEMERRELDRWDRRLATEALRLLCRALRAGGAGRDSEEQKRSLQQAEFRLCRLDLVGAARGGC